MDFTFKPARSYPESYPPNWPPYEYYVDNRDVPKLQAQARAHLYFIERIFILQGVSLFSSHNDSQSGG